MTEDDIMRYNASDHVAEIGLNRLPVNAMSFSLLEQRIADNDLVRIEAGNLFVGQR